MLTRVQILMNNRPLIPEIGCNIHSICKPWGLLSKSLGYKSFQTTEKYIHPKAEDLTTWPFIVYKELKTSPFFTFGDFVTDNPGVKA